MALLVLIDADPNRAGCRLRWLNLERLAKTQGIKVQLLSQPSEKPLSKHDLPTLCRRLPKEMRLWIREVVPKLRRIWFVLTLARARIVVTGKPNDPLLIDGMNIARWFGTRLIVDAYDIKPSYLHIHKAFELASCITIPTKKLGAAIPIEQHHKIHVIPDYLDKACLPKTHQRKESHSPANILWFGVIEADGPSKRPSFKLFCDFIATSINQLELRNVSITLVCSHSEAAVRYLKEILSPHTLPCTVMEWSLANMQKALAQPGLAVIPYPTPINNCQKSANRVELALYAGKTVLVNGELPSLDPVLRKYISEIKTNIDLAATTRLETSLTTIRNHLDKKQSLIDERWQSLIP